MYVLLIYLLIYPYTARYNLGNNFLGKNWMNKFSLSESEAIFFSNPLSHPSLHNTHPFFQELHNMVAAQWWWAISKRKSSQIQHLDKILVYKVIYQTEREGLSVLLRDSDFASERERTLLLDKSTTTTTGPDWTWTFISFYALCYWLAAPV